MARLRSHKWFGLVTMQGNREMRQRQVVGFGCCLKVMRHCGRVLTALEAGSWVGRLMQSSVREVIRWWGTKSMSQPKEVTLTRLGNYLDRGESEVEHDSLGNWMDISAPH